eukprot:7598832-Alexandrium_andersonii.AAC.1
MSELPRLLAETTQLRFIVASERRAEGKHSQVHLKSIHRYVTLDYVSLGLRLPEWEDTLRNEPA